MFFDPRRAKRHAGCEKPLPFRNESGARAPSLPGDYTVTTKRRTFGHLLSMEGDQVGSLTVGAPVSTAPLKYRVRCGRCGTDAVLSHTQLRNRNLPCPNTACGREGLREVAAETLGRMRQREAAAQRQVERDREAAQRKRVTDAEAELARTSASLARVERENLQKLPDDRLFLSDAVKQARMTQDEASRFNAEEARKFQAMCPEYAAKYRSAANYEVIGNYMVLNNVRIADAVTVKRAFERLRDAGMLTPNPTPTPTPAPKPKPTPAPVAEKPAALALPDGSERGFDLLTGQPRTYSKFEIDRLSATEYRRIFRLTKADLQLPV